jgi:hypothetical protein
MCPAFSCLLAAWAGVNQAPGPEPMLRTLQWPDWPWHPRSSPPGFVGHWWSCLCHPKRDVNAMTNKWTCCSSQAKPQAVAREDDPHSLILIWTLLACGCGSWICSDESILHYAASEVTLNLQKGSPLLLKVCSCNQVKLHEAFFNCPKHQETQLDLWILWAWLKLNVPACSVWSHAKRNVQACSV